MDEEVRARVVGRDEPEALVVVEPLHGAGRHLASPLRFAGPHARPERGKVPVSRVCVTLDMLTPSDLVASVGVDRVRARTTVDHVARSVTRLDRVVARARLDLIAPWTGVDAVLSASG